MISDPLKFTYLSQDPRGFGPNSANDLAIFFPQLPVPDPNLQFSKPNENLRNPLISLVPEVLEHITSQMTVYQRVRLKLVCHAMYTLLTKFEPPPVEHTSKAVWSWSRSKASLLLLELLIRPPSLEGLPCGVLINTFPFQKPDMVYPREVLTEIVVELDEPKFKKYMRVHLVSVNNFGLTLGPPTVIKA